MAPLDGARWALRACLRMGARAGTRFTLCTLLAMAAAQTGSPAAASTPGAALSPFGTLLALFDSAYAPSATLKAEAAALAGMARDASLAQLPSFSATERLAWHDYGALGISLELAAELPIYRSLAAPTAAMQAHREATQASRAAAAAAAARAQFVLTVLALALTQELENEATAATARFAAEVWQPPTNLADALHVAPSERELLALYRSVVNLAEFAAGNAAELRRELTRTLGTSVTDLPLPKFAAAIAALDMAPPTLDSCLATGPEASAARQRFEQRLLGLTLERTTELEVNLFGQVGYQGGFGAGATGVAPSVAGLQAQLGVAVRLAMPDGWPVSGEVGATAHLGGAEQTLSLSWPPVRRNAHSLGHAAALEDASGVLAAELAQLTSEASAQLRAYADATAAVENAEAQLLWLAFDVHPDALDLDSARTLASRTFDNPVLELHAVSYRADVAFAQLTLATQLADLQVLCGVGALGTVRAGEVALP